MTPTTLEEYKKAVKTLANNRSSFTFDNKGGAHAATVLSNIFDISSEVRIYASTMNGDISEKEDYRSSLHNFFEQDKKLFVLLDDDQHCSGVVKELFKSNSTKVKIVKSSKQFIEFTKVATKPQNYPYHFAIGDDSCFRVELNPETHEAMCSFNNPDIVKSLREIFDYGFNSGEESNLG